MKFLLCSVFLISILSENLFAQRQGTIIVEKKKIWPHLDVSYTFDLLSRTRSKVKLKEYNSYFNENNFIQDHKLIYRRKDTVYSPQLFVKEFLDYVLEYAYLPGDTLLSDTLFVTLRFFKDNTPVAIERIDSSYNCNPALRKEIIQKLQLACIRPSQVSRLDTLVNQRRVARFLDISRKITSPPPILVNRNLGYFKMKKGLFKKYDQKALRFEAKCMIVVSPKPIKKKLFSMVEYSYLGYYKVRNGDTINEKWYSLPPLICSGNVDADKKFIKNTNSFRLEQYIDYLLDSYVGNGKMQQTTSRYEIFFTVDGSGNLLKVRSNMIADDKPFNNKLYEELVKLSRESTWQGKLRFNINEDLFNHDKKILGKNKKKEYIIKASVNCSEIPLKKGKPLPVYYSVEKKYALVDSDKEVDNYKLIPENKWFDPIFHSSEETYDSTSNEKRKLFLPQTQFSRDFVAKKNMYYVLSTDTPFIDTLHVVLLIDKSGYIKKLVFPEHKENYDSYLKNRLLDYFIGNASDTRVSGMGARKRFTAGGVLLENLDRKTGRWKREEKIRRRNFYCDVVIRFSSLPISAYQYGTKQFYDKLEK